TNGSILWQQTTQDQSSGNTGSAVFDFEGDGIAEAIYPDERTVWGFNGPDGAVKLSFTGHSSNTWTEYSVIADIDNDDHAEIIITHNDTSGGTYNGITVIEDADDSWQAGTKIWNQHTYSITNINEDGSIPILPEPNWFSYNNFRSGDLAAATGGSQGDLYSQIVFICRDECEQGNVYVLVTVGNQGTLDIETPVTLELWALKADGSQVILDVRLINGPILSGQQLEGIEFAVSHPDLHSFVDIFAVVDPAMIINECRENNNQSYWSERICQ
ncbi:MAG: hypothetical protein VX278_22840, partial [Myxococcota bacterium]|nr:hypothetical protein [Myxococcota bacterium]